ncbi:MAG: Rid family detoxifying hydrolase [Leptospirillum sp.]|jgi:2-iminobutanoate/2-iminopropanoate deaminase|nr:Rid family detoxifying hydrolase [Nitrospiraceae bacterium]
MSVNAFPVPVGPYQIARRHGNLLFLSGQIPLDPDSGNLVEGGISIQTERVILNIAGVLKSYGLDWKSVLKVTVFLTDLNDFPEMNAVYSRLIGEPYPARSTIGVAGLPKSSRIEIEAIAAV